MKMKMKKVVCAINYQLNTLEKHETGAGWAQGFYFQLFFINFHQLPIFYPFIKNKQETACTLIYHSCI